MQQLLSAASHTAAIMQGCMYVCMYVRPSTSIALLRQSLKEKSEKNRYQQST